MERFYVVRMRLEKSDGVVDWARPIQLSHAAKWHSFRVENLDCVQIAGQASLFGGN
jgi:hypothetical protein